MLRISAIRRHPLIYKMMSTKVPNATAIAIPNATAISAHCKCFDYEYINSIRAPKALDLLHSRPCTTKCGLKQMIHTKRSNEWSLGVALFGSGIGGIFLYDGLIDLFPNVVVPDIVGYIIIWIPFTGFCLMMMSM